MKNSPVTLFLYSEIGPYNLPVFEELVKTFKSQVHVVRWDKNCLKPYKPRDIDGVCFYYRSSFDKNSLEQLIREINPDLVYVSGWMDKLYLQCVLPLKIAGVPVIVGFDDIWKGSLRQTFGKYFFRFYLNKYFTHAWVAGDPQYEFARRLGFDSERIIFDLLSADVDRFSLNEYRGNGSYFLYVGNFRDVKGTKILAEAYEYYRNELNGNIDLICIGNGDLRACLLSKKNIKVLDYLNQDELTRFVKDSVAFVLPSKHDQWGVVVHEFASAGLPLIVSTGVGARSKFLINQYNGLTFPNGSVKDLAQTFKVFESLSIEQRLMMSERSKILSKRVSPQSSAANFISVLEGV